MAIKRRDLFKVATMALGTIRDGCAAVDTSHQIKVVLGPVPPADLGRTLIHEHVFISPGGRLADRFGPRKIPALGTGWCAVPNTLSVLLGVCFCLGLGEAVVSSDWTERCDYKCLHLIRYQDREHPAGPSLWHPLEQQ
jgi:hypothetical protein